MASSSLLAEIQAGKRLKASKTNDRSSPIVAVDTKKSTVSSGGPSVSNGGGVGAMGGAGPPQLGGLFAGGMPKLKPAGQTPSGKLIQHLSTSPKVLISSE
jgi:hypothetical protein